MERKYAAITGFPVRDRIVTSGINRERATDFDSPETFSAFHLLVRDKEIAEESGLQLRDTAMREEGLPVEVDHPLVTPVDVMAGLVAADRGLLATSLAVFEEGSVPAACKNSTRKPVSG